jgi:F-type H+-transporting ATPase subunit b
MNEFLDQFGIDWKLLVSQLVNFLLILTILRLFVYKPLLKILNTRKDKIKEGLEKAEEAGIRLKEVDEISKNKLKETNEKCVSLLTQTDVKKKQIEAEIIIEAKKKEEALFKKAEALVDNQKKELFEKIRKEASELIKSAIAKGISLEPDKVDDKLIKKATEILKNEL